MTTRYVLKRKRRSLRRAILCAAVVPVGAFIAFGVAPHPPAHRAAVSAAHRAVQDHPAAPAAHAPRKVHGSHRVAGMVARHIARHLLLAHHVLGFHRWFWRPRFRFWRRSYR